VPKISLQYHGSPVLQASRSEHLNTTLVADGTPGSIAGNQKVCVYLVARVVFMIANVGDHPFATLHMALQLVPKADVAKGCCLRNDWLKKSLTGQGVILDDE